MKRVVIILVAGGLLLLMAVGTAWLASRPTRPLTDEQLVQRHFGVPIVAYTYPLTLRCLDLPRIAQDVCRPAAAFIEQYITFEARVTYIECGFNSDCANLGRTLSPQVGDLDALRELVLWDTPIAQLPPQISNLTELQTLTIIDSDLSNLPPEIGTLTNLQALHLRGNALTELPPEIGTLTQLETLDLRGNRLRDLPPEIGTLRNLKLILLNDNPLGELPPVLQTLPNLQQIEWDVPQESVE